MADDLNSAPDASDGKPELGSSPLPGCVILITVVVVFGLLATVFTIVFHKQSDYFRKVSTETPVEVPSVTPTEERVAEVTDKLDRLLAAADADELVRIEFTAEDFNTLIGSRELLADFRGQTHVRGISEKGIEAEMTQPIRSGFLRQGIRYLHGTFWLKPEFTGKTVLFRVADIELPGEEVPEGLVNSYPSFMKLDPKLPPFDRVLPKLGKIYVEGDRVIVETRGETEP